MRITMRKNDETKVQRNKLPDIILEQLMEWIMEGKLSMGDKLNPDELAVTLGVSRMPVREALAILERMGLAETIPYVGTKLVCLNRKKVEEIYLAREALEPILASYACQNITESELSHIEKIHLEYSNLVKQNQLDPIHVYEMNRKFHFAIYQSSGLSRICEMVENLWDNLAFFKLIYGQRLLRSEELKEKMIGEHSSYLEALRVKDSQKLFDLLKQNLRNRVLDIGFYQEGYFEQVKVM